MRSFEAIHSELLTQLLNKLQTKRIINFMIAVSEVHEFLVTRSLYKYLVKGRGGKQTNP
jgi:hypothetical protein